MIRRNGTNKNGGIFDNSTIKAVFNKANVAPDSISPNRRVDVCNAIIDWEKYGDTTDKGTGWEIDHIIPVALGGTDDLSNLQPLQWQNNRGKSDDMRWNCTIRRR